MNRPGFPPPFGHHAAAVLPPRGHPAFYPPPILYWGYPSPPVSPTTYYGPPHRIPTTTSPAITQPPQYHPQHQSFAPQSPQSNPYVTPVATVADSGLPPPQQHDKIATPRVLTPSVAPNQYIE
uniref:Uncharacterized protein n=1 Tax=Lutzomyia longipalpis TaxID=7200 RepID=A0A1B0CWB9_LUTLO